MSVMREPHRLDVRKDFPASFGWVQHASATTADDSQRKRLEVEIGKVNYRVRRKYCAPDEDWQTIYEGDNLAEAVRLYNSLS